MPTDNRLEYYSLLDDVWKETGLGPRDGMLCIKCVEKRIGRRLKSTDFEDVLINKLEHSWNQKSDLLISRLTDSPSVP
jgi:hypothetical protein